MGAATWDASIVITTTILALAQGFGDLKVLLITALATNSLNGSRVVSYSSYADMQTANTAGYISAGTLAAGAAFFGQTPHGSVLKVANWDLVGLETAAACITAIQVVDNDWYYVLTDQRGDTNLLAMATAINTLGNDPQAGMKFFIGQSASAFNTNTYPVALTTLQTMTRAAIVYHATTSIWNDVAWAAKLSGFDQDSKSPGWMWVSLDGITLPVLTPTTLGYIKTNNANALAPAGTFTGGVMGQGYGTDGTPIKSRVTADVLTKTLLSRISNMLVNCANQGQPIAVNARGQAAILAVIAATFSDMANAGHFEAGQIALIAEAISAADRTARRLRFTDTAQLIEQLVTTSVANYLTPSPVIV